MRLSNIEDCLCAFRNELLPHDLWVMKEYNKKQSWEILQFNREIKYDAIHCVKLMAHYIPNKRSLCHKMVRCDSRLLLGTPLFVDSLVSPHFRKKPKRKSQTKSIMKSPKVKPNNVVVALYTVSQAKADVNANAIYVSGASTSANV